MGRTSFNTKSFVSRLIEASKKWHDIDDGVLRPLQDEALALSREHQASLVVTLFEVAGNVAELASNDKERRFWELLNYHSRCDHAYAVAKLGARLLRRSLPLTESDLCKIVAACVRLEVVSTHFMVHIPAAVRYIESHWEGLESHRNLRKLLAGLARNARRTNSAPEIKLAERIEKMLGPTDALPVDAGEAWSDQARNDLAKMKSAQRKGWIALIEHCKAGSGATPSGKWSTAGQALVEKVGAAEFVERVLKWLPLVDKPRTAPAPTGQWRSDPVADQLILAHHSDALKGLCWIAGSIPDARLARALRALAVSSYRKVPGIGPRAVKVGNAAVYALGRMPGRDSLGQLAILCVKIKFGTAQKLIDKALDAAAQRESLPRDEIEEMAVPSYGMTEVGRAREQLGENAAVLTINSASGASAVSLMWTNAKSRTVKAVPAEVRRDHAQELKDLKATAKDIQKMLPAQRDRIDSLFLEQKTWAYPTWCERYLDHPLVGTIARRLIWVIDDARSKRSGVWLPERNDGLPSGPGCLVDVKGRKLDIDATPTIVSLWHPIDSEGGSGSEVRDDVLAWRAFFEERGIRQPFKQAHREVYLLTDAERRTEVYSNRFAAHVLRQHQFNALCGQRGWKNRLRLMVDAEYSPAHRVLRTWNLRAEFWIEGVGDDFVPEYVLDSGAFRFLATDQVRFYRIDAAENVGHALGGRYETRRPDESANHPLPLCQIPPIVLSEVLRDVDLFVGVSSVGNNPEWADGGPNGQFRDYWHAYSFGDLSATAQTRRELLQRLIPRLTIASACTVTDKFLVVLGKKRTYKIHLGSGNILMAPNDQYLCIVPTSRMESGPGDGRLFLPFEGDRNLAIILSKAFMLAADDQITDRSITSQINRVR